MRSFRFVACTLAVLLSLPTTVPAALLPVGTEFQVNTFTTGTQYGFWGRAVARAADGSFVVIWRSPDQDGDGNGIFGQRFDSSGAPAGAEFQVNTWTTLDQSKPAVSASADGSFVVVWQSNDQDGDSGGIFGQRFDSSGVPAGAEFQVNTYTTSGQSNAKVSVAPDGSFVVVWSSDQESFGADSVGIYGQRYDSSGAPAGAEFHVNTYTTLDQYLSSVAVADDNSFTVVWGSNGQDGDGWSIQGQRFDSSGAPVGAEFQVNTYTTSYQTDPKIDGKGDGSFVVIWSDALQDGGGGAGVHGQRFDSSGTPAGAEFQVNTYTTGTQYYPGVAVSGDGSFVVAWHSWEQDGSQYSVQGQRYDGTGAAAGPEFQVNTYTTGFQGAPSVAVDASGNFIVVWNSDQEGAGGIGVVGQQFCPDEDNDLTCDVPPPPVLDGLLFDGSEFQVNTYTTGTQYGFWGRAVARAADGSFVVIWRSPDQDGDGNGIFGQRFDSSGAPAGAEFQVNTWTTLDQSKPAVSASADGSFVVVWQSNDQDGDSGGIFGQRFDSSGVPAGAEFQVNTYTTSGQSNAKVSVAPDGSFVVVWSSDQESFGADSVGIYGQRYDSSGAPAGAEFHVNTYTTLDQYLSSVAVADDNSFTVVWGSNGQDGDGWSIQGQRFDSSGAPVGAEFQVNTYTTSYQTDPKIDGKGDGSFVVIWSDALQDGGGGAGVHGQRFDSSGTPAGAEFQVNTYTTGTQYYPGVAVSGDGSFVVAWHSWEQDGSQYSVQGQRYDGTGAAAGPEFQVNTYTTGFQGAPSVAVDASGNFIVVWNSDQEGAGGIGVVGQRLCRDADDDLACDATVPDEGVAEPVAAGGTVTSDPEADGATPADPIESSITSPNPGIVTVYERVVSTDPPVFQIDITAPAASVADPLVLVFRVDATLAASFEIRRNGTVVGGECTGAPGTASPDPCVDSVEVLPDGDALVTVLTSAASQWQLEALPEVGNCADTPVTGCITGQKASLQMRDNASDDEKDQFKWKLSKAAAVDQALLGDPVAARAYSLCIYDQTGGTPILAATVHVDPNSAWDSKDPKGFSYSDKTGAEDGVTKASLKTGDAGKSSVSVSAKGINIPMPTPFSATEVFNQDTAVIVQLVNDETATCWTSSFTTSTKNDGVQFKAKAP